MKYFLVALMLFVAAQFAHGGAHKFCENIVPEDGYMGGPQRLRCPDGRFVVVPEKRWEEIIKDGKMCWPKSVSDKWVCADYIENARAMGCHAGQDELLSAAEGLLPYLDGLSIGITAAGYPLDIEKRSNVIKRFREAWDRAKYGHK